MAQKKERSVYIRMLVSFTTVVILILLVMIFFCSSLFSRQYTDEVEKAQLNAIRYENNLFRSAVPDRASEMAKTLTNDLSDQDLYITPLTRKDDSYNVAIYQIYRKLNAFVGLNSDILEQIIVFYPGQNICISSQAGYKIMNQSVNQGYQMLYQTLTKQPGGKICFQYLSGLLNKSESGNLIFTVFPLWNMEGGQPVCFAFFIRENYLSATVQNMHVEGQGVYLIHRGDGICFHTTDPEYDPAFLDTDPVRTLLAEASDSPRTETDERQQMIYAHCAMSGTDLSVLVSMSLESWRGSARNIRISVAIVGTIALILACTMILLLTRRFYTPLRVISDLVHELPAVSIRNMKNEYQIIRTGIDELMNLLSHSQRVLHTNHSLIRNQTLRDLLTGANTSAPTDTLSYLGIRFPHECFSLYAVEYCGEDAATLPPETRNILAVGLTEVIENKAASGDLIIHGVIIRQNTVCFIINHPHLEDNFSDLAEMISAYFDCYQIRSYQVLNPECVYSFRHIGQLYPQINYLLSGRLFDLREEKIHVTLNTEDATAFSTLLDTVTDPESKTDDVTLLHTVQEMTASMSRMAPPQAQLCFQKCLAALRSYIVSQKLELSPEWIDPQKSFWKISELPELLERSLHFARREEENGEDVSFMQSVRAYVDQHIMEDISLDAMGDELGFNAKYFSRKFKKASGLTFSNYVTNRRMELAAAQLRSGRESIEQISKNFGFSSVQYFGRRFRETYGITPGEYRKMSSSQTLE